MARRIRGSWVEWDRRYPALHSAFWRLCCCIGVSVETIALTMVYHTLFYKIHPNSDFHSQFHVNVAFLQLLVFSKDSIDH